MQKIWYPRTRIQDALYAGKLYSLHVCYWSIVSMLLFLSQLGMILVPIGLFLYGWSSQEHTHFIVPLLGSFIFAFGMLMTYVRAFSFIPLNIQASSPQICIQTYLVDAFGQYAASALAATIVLRSIFGAIFSIFGVQLYRTLDYGWCVSDLQLM
jgi:hypothetical protein